MDNLINLLEENLQSNKSFDICKREIIKNHNKITIYYITGLCDLIQIENILQIISIKDFDDINSIIPHPQIEISNDISDITTKILRGLMVLIYDKCYIIDVRNYQTRGI